MLKIFHSDSCGRLHTLCETLLTVIRFLTFPYFFYDGLINMLASKFIGVDLEYHDDIADKQRTKDEPDKTEKAKTNDYTHNGNNRMHVTQSAQESHSCEVIDIASYKYAIYKQRSGVPVITSCISV